MGMAAVGGDRGGWARKAGGWALLATGVAGCVLPVIPGIPLAVAGLMVLARDYKWARSALDRTKRHADRLRNKTKTKTVEAAMAANGRSGAEES